MNARQRDVVRAAASAYAGLPVQIAVQRPSGSERNFAQAFATALKSAGVVVSVVAEGQFVTAECQLGVGLNAVYGAVRSGAVNAIAEALIKSGVTSDSVRGCRVRDEDALTFVIVGRVSSAGHR